MSDHETALALRQEGFAGLATTDVGETASVAVAARAKAAVEARHIVAMKMRRNIKTVEAELMEDCARPAFAEAARYRLEYVKDKNGDPVEGPSIRFVEAALQYMGNCDTEVATIYDDEFKRIVQVTVTDYERNLTHSKQITVLKQVERRYLKKGQTAISKRTNSSGATTYLVEATEADILSKEANLASKALRECGKRMIPGWLVDQAMGAIRDTLVRAAATELAKPTEVDALPAFTARLVAGFERLGATAADLAAYLGHPLMELTPEEHAGLVALGTTIRDGETSWANALAEKTGGQAPESAIPAAPAPIPSGRGTAAVKAAIAPQAKQTPPPAQPMTVRLDLAPDVAPRHPALMADEAPAEPAPAKTRKAKAKPPIDTTATETPHDPVTGEVTGTLEMPDWMSDGPADETPPDGGF